MSIPKNPLGIIDIMDTVYAPWFADAEVRVHRGHRGIGILASSQYGDGNGYVTDEGEPTIARFLSPGKIQKAFEACALDGRLCCSGSMAAGEYSDGCAEDADQILQQAVYGKVVWA